MTIPEPRYYLKDTKSLNPTLIYLQAKYSINGQSQRVTLICADKILPLDWDNVKQRAIVSKRNLAAGEINLLIDKMGAAFKSSYRNLLIENIVPTQIAVKERMEEILNLRPKIIIQKMTFYLFMNNFISDNQINKKANTLKAYNSTIKVIKEYGSVLKKEIHFEDINLSWYTLFIKFLQNKGLCNSSVGKYIKNLKSILNSATEQGYNSNLIFRTKSFSKPSEDSHKTFVSENEILQLLNTDLEDDKMKNIVRDYFVISTLTGLRFSDLVRIKKENIINDRIQIVTLKTGAEVIIPIASHVKFIFEKYDYNLPKCPCNQVYNRVIKQIGKQAGLDGTEVITKTIGGIITTKRFEKWQLLCSHTGRRSFVSNAILSGINTSAIMLISGHKSHSVFNTYVRFDNHQNAENLSKHSFFK